MSHPALKNNPDFISTYKPYLESEKEILCFFNILNERDNDKEQIAMLKDKELLAKATAKTWLFIRGHTGKCSEIRSTDNENLFPGSRTDKTRLSARTRLRPASYVFKQLVQQKIDIPINKEEYLEVFSEELEKFIKEHPESGRIFSYKLDCLLTLLPSNKAEKLRQKMSIAGWPVKCFLGRFESKDVEKTDIPEFEKLIDLWGTGRRKQISSPPYFIQRTYLRLLEIGNQKLAYKWLNAFSNYYEPANFIAQLLQNKISSPTEFFKRHGNVDYEQWESFRDYAPVEFFLQSGKPETALLVKGYADYAYSKKLNNYNFTKLILIVFALPLILAALFWCFCMLFCLIPEYRSSKEERKRVYSPTITQAIVLLGGFITLQVGLTLALVAMHLNAPHAGLIGIVNLSCFVMIIWIGLAWYKVDFKTAFPFSEFSPKLLSGITLTVLGLIITCSEADNLLQSIMPMPASIKEPMMKIATQGFSSFITIGVIAPVFEEMVFRGLILRGLTKNYGIKKAVIISSILFAVFHLNPYQFFGAFVAGLFLGWLVYLSNSLWPSIIAHALFNIINITAAMLFSSSELISSSDPIQFQPWWLNVIGVAGIALGIYMIHKMIKQNKTPMSIQEIIH